MKRTKRSSSFKKKVAIEALREQRTINEIAAEYEVHPAQVSQWRKELLDGAELVFDRGRKERITSEEGARKESDFHRKIGQLTIEIDWLKKKLEI